MCFSHFHISSTIRKRVYFSRCCSNSMAFFCSRSRFPSLETSQFACWFFSKISFDFFLLCKVEYSPESKETHWTHGLNLHTNKFASMNACKQNDQRKITTNHEFQRPTEAASKVMTSWSGCIILFSQFLHWVGSFTLRDLHALVKTVWNRLVFIFAAQKLLTYFLLCCLRTISFSMNEIECRPIIKDNGAYGTEWNRNRHQQQCKWAQQRQKKNKQTFIPHSITKRNVYKTEVL